jgi:hypothetical protein
VFFQRPANAFTAMKVARMKEIELNFTVSKLGEGRITSPITGVRFVDDEEHVLYHSDFMEIKGYLDAGIKPPWMEKAGPREKIYFHPAGLGCGILPAAWTMRGACGVGRQDRYDRGLLESPGDSCTHIPGSIGAKKTGSRRLDLEQRSGHHRATTSPCLGVVRDAACQP